MIKVGLTGGIGSGKSTVARYFEELDAPVIDADVVAREVTEQGQPGYLAITLKFGDSILQPSGDIDRKKLREIIFKDSESKKWLEDLLHPLIRQTIAETIVNLQFPYCIIAIPLLVETKSYDLIDRVLVVESDIELQIQRTMARDGISEEEALSIIDSQASSAHRRQFAQDIIYNNGDLHQLRLEVNQLHAFYSKLA
jgi:dephospho-CoA kinase